MPNWLLKVYTDLIEFDIFFSVIFSKTLLSTAGYDKIFKLHLGRHFLEQFRSGTTTVTRSPLSFPLRGRVVRMVSGLWSCEISTGGVAGPRIPW